MDVYITSEVSMAWVPFLQSNLVDENSLKSQALSTNT